MLWLGSLGARLLCHALAAIEGMPAAPPPGSAILFPPGQGEESRRRRRCLQVGDAYVLVYSVTDRGSFESASELRIQLRRARQAEDIPIILVGNKTDLVRCREVSLEGERGRQPLAGCWGGSLAAPRPSLCP